ncbi:MAG: LysR family transcriptional regulator [Roseibium sp.]|nr:LysR family transcriptional regulator [Roseibium sp.]
MEQRDLNDLATFAAIAQAGSITGAAERLGLPKSNVSRRLARLEARLGVQLLERNTRSSRLTSVGTCYADFCRMMVEEADAADALIDQSLAEPAGELRISASVLIGQQIIAPAIAAYSKSYPKVRIVLELSNARMSLIDDGFDLAFRIGENQDSSMMVQAVTSYHLNLYASPAYLADHGVPETPEDLKDHRCLVMGVGSTQSVWTFQREDETVEVPVDRWVVINDFLTLRNLAVADGGLTLLPAYAARSEERKGALNRVLSDWNSFHAVLSAVYPSRRGASIKQRAFIECVKQSADALK